MSSGPMRVYKLGGFSSIGVANCLSLIDGMSKTRRLGKSRRVVRKLPFFIGERLHRKILLNLVADDA